MRASATVLAFLLAAGAAAAQETRPDYSRDTLMRITAEVAEESENARRFRQRFGTIDVRAFGTTFRVGYLNLMMPLSGTEFRTILNAPPDPFALTNTQIATSPRAWRTRREVNAELRRIEESEKAKQRIRVDE